MSSRSHLLRRWSTTTIHVALLTVLGLGLYLHGITWGLPNIHDWANLSLAPIQPLSYAKHLLYGETWLFHYPPLHFLVLAVVYSPYVVYLLATGGLGTPTEAYPYGLANPDVSLTVFILLARLTSVVMAIGLLIVNYLTVRRFYASTTTALVSSFLIACAYPIVHYAHHANVDIPYLFWLSLALYCFVRLVETPATRWYVLLALFTALAVGTKHTAFALAAGLIPTLLYVHYRAEKARRPDATVVSALLDRRLAYGAGLFGVVLVVIFNPILNWEGFAAHVGQHKGTSFGAGGSWVLQTASSTLWGHLALIGRYVDYIRQSQGLPGFILLAGGFVYCLIRYPRHSLIIGLPILTYYLLFLRGFGTHHVRYILPVYVLCTWQAGRLAADVLETRRIPRWVPGLALAGILAHVLLYGFTVNYLYARDARYDAERWLAENLREGAAVLAIEPTYSLPRIPKRAVVVYRGLWDFNGNLIADITDVRADYVVVGMSIPRRAMSDQAKVPWVTPIDVDAFLKERGYERVASFQRAVPAWGAVVPDLHAINPRVAIWRAATSARVAGVGRPGPTGQN